MPLFSTFTSPNIDKLTTKQDIPGLIKALRYKKNDTIRAYAALALGDIKSPLAIEPLINSLNDEWFGVRIASSIALGKIGDERATEPLLAVRETKFVFPISHDFLGRTCYEAAVEALGEIKDHRATEALINDLNEEQGHTDQGICCILVALGKIGDTRAIEPLINFFHDEYKKNYHKELIIEALGNIGDPNTVGFLLDTTKRYCSWAYSENVQFTIASRCALLKILEKSIEQISLEDLYSILDLGDRNIDDLWLRRIRSEASETIENGLFSYSKLRSLVIKELFRRKQNG